MFATPLVSSATTIKLNIGNIFLRLTRSTIIIIYFFSKVKTVGAHRFKAHLKMYCTQLNGAQFVLSQPFNRVRTFVYGTRATLALMYQLLQFRLVWEVMHLKKKLYHLHNNTRFCILKYFMNLCLCDVFVGTTFVTIPEFENNQEFKPKPNCIIIIYYNFG